MQLFPKSLSPLRINIKSSCHQLKIKIPQCGRSVDIANLTPFSSPYHCPANGILNSLFSVIHNFYLLLSFIFVFRPGAYPQPAILFSGHAASF